jgi:hypothetical protein
MLFLESKSKAPAKLSAIARLVHVIGSRGGKPDYLREAAVLRAAQPPARPLPR